MELTTDVLVVGAGGAGMYAAIAAAREGANVLLMDKNMVGRGGATIMAQMTVAAALGEEEPDSWEDHLADTLAAGRGPRAALAGRGQFGLVDKSSSHAHGEGTRGDEEECINQDVRK